MSRSAGLAIVIKKIQGLLERKITLKFCHRFSTNSLVSRWGQSCIPSLLKCHHAHYFNLPCALVIPTKLASWHTLESLRTSWRAHRTWGLVIQQHQSTAIGIIIRFYFIKFCILPCFLLISDWRNVSPLLIKNCLGITHGACIYNNNTG